MAAAFVNLLCFQTPYRNKTTRIEKNVSFVIWLLEQTISLSQNHVNYIETCSDAIMNTVLFSVSFASANHLLTNFCRPSCRHLRARKDLRIDFGTICQFELKSQRIINTAWNQVYLYIKLYETEITVIIESHKLATANKNWLFSAFNRSSFCLIAQYEFQRCSKLWLNKMWSTHDLNALLIRSVVVVLRDFLCLSLLNSNLWTEVRRVYTESVVSRY